MGNVETALAKLDEIVGDSDFALDTMDIKKKFTMAFAMSMRMQQIKALITDDIMIALVMPLKDNGLGFKTDESSRRKDSPNFNYSVEQLRCCVIEAVLRGANIIGNEFNVLAGRMYLTKEFYDRKTVCVPGVTDRDIEIGLPRVGGDGRSAEVKGKVTWLNNGKPEFIERTFSVRVNAGMGADAVQGKCKRKILAAAYEKMTGIRSADGDVDDEGIAIKPVEGRVVDDPVTHTVTATLHVDATPAAQQSSTADKAKAAVKATKARNAAAPVQEPAKVEPTAKPAASTTAKAAPVVDATKGVKTLVVKNCTQKCTSDKGVEPKTYVYTIYDPERGVSAKDNEGAFLTDDPAKFNDIKDAIKDKVTPITIEYTLEKDGFMWIDRAYVATNGASLLDPEVPDANGEIEMPGV